MMVCGIEGIRYVIEFSRIDKKESQLSGTMHGYKSITGISNKFL
jgi:hypothetical protein